MRPVLLRPPWLRRPSVSAFTGSPFHSSLRSTMTSCRCEGVVGLNVLSAMASDSRRHVDGRAFGQGDHRLFGVAALAGTAAEAFGLAQAADRVDRVHLD